MGFSGGGSNVLLPHTHDGTIAQDGGPLNFNNITQSSSAAGQVFFSDGVHLQQLSIGAANDELRVNAGATAPEWYTPAAGGQTYELVAHQVVAASPTIQVTIAPAINQSDISKLVVVWNGQTSVGNGLNFTINGISTNTYNHFGAYYVAAGQTTIVNTAQSSVRMVYGSMARNSMAVAEISCNNESDELQGTITAGGATGSAFQGFNNTTAGQTSFSEIRVDDKGGNNLGAGSSLTIYKVLSS